MDLPNYDAWKLATPPEYERDEEDGAPAAGKLCPRGCGYLGNHFGGCPGYDEDGKWHGAGQQKELPPEEDVPW